MYKKIQNLRNLKQIILKLKKKKKTIVFTNGCFDLLHYGHVEYLQKAKKSGDILIVALNSDASVRRLKGKKRPLTPLRYRMQILAALAVVDFVTSFNELTPRKIIEALRPDVLLKGGDWKLDNIIGKDILESYGGKIITIAYTTGFSTSNLIKKIAKEN